MVFKTTLINHLDVIKPSGHNQTGCAQQQTRSNILKHTIKHINITQYTTQHHQTLTLQTHTNIQYNIHYISHDTLHITYNIHTHILTLHAHIPHNITIIMPI